MDSIQATDTCMMWAVELWKAAQRYESAELTGKTPQSMAESMMPAQQQEVARK